MDHHSRGPEEEKQVWLRLSEPQHLITSQHDHTRPYLVHYTSLGVLKGILNGRQLWFSQASRMNDFSEVSRGLNLIIEMDQSKLSPIRPAIDLIRSTNRTAWNTCHATFNKSYNRLADNVFLSSWSARTHAGDIDDLVMWRAYGDDGKGVAIVIDPAVLELSANFASSIIATPVFYEDKRAFAVRATEALNAFALVVEGLGPNKANEFADYIGETFFNLCMLLACTHKHPGFISEKEWRFVWTRHTVFHEVLHDHVAEREDGRQVLRLPLLDEAFEPEEKVAAGTIDPRRLIKAVMIGPSDHQSEQERLVQEAKESAGAHFKIDRSEIPYRSAK